MRTLLGTLTLSLALTGCSLFGDDGPTAKDAATELAEDLTAGRVEDAWWTDATEGLGDARLDVSVGEVTEREGTADARLTYQWTLPEGPVWRYGATARFEKGEDSWTLAPSPSTVAPDLREGERLALSREWPERADILGAGDRPIVTDRDVVRIGIDKTKVAVAALASSARALAQLVEVDAAELVKEVGAAGPKAFVEAIVLRSSDLAGVPARLQAIPGAVAIEDTLPLAPTREFARPILGTVGAVTAEIVEKSRGVYRAGDEAGLSGLQARYDEQLRGTVGVRIDAVAADGERRPLQTFDAEPGEPLHLTLDPDLQVTAEGLLANVEPASAIVALQPSTGQVLAAASGPGGGGLSTATVGKYAPGSTMKVVSSLALLRAGLNARSAMACPPTTVVDGKRFKNYSDYPSAQLGRIDLARALASSCNTAFIGQRDRVRQAELADAAAALGLGVDHDLGYPVFLGSVPAPATSETDHAASMIGQGRVEASPVAMAAVAASVTSGRTVVPTLVRDSPAVEAAPAQPLREGEVGLLRSLMRGVVTSGSGAFLADVPGAPVLAKTGTAEFGDKTPPATHAWMIAARGDLAVAVFVDVGESGSRTAGPILEAFLRAAA